MEEVTDFGRFFILTRSAGAIPRSVPFDTVTAAIGSTLALSRHYQPEAVIPQRRCSVSVADHLNKPLGIDRKGRFTPITSQVVIHSETV